MMSDSLRGNVSSQKLPELVINLGETPVFRAHRVYSFQKSVDKVEISCSASRPVEVLNVLPSLSFDDILTLSYCGVKFENYTCVQWSIMPNDLSLPGESKLELIFKLCDNIQHEEILTD